MIHAKRILHITHGVGRTSFGIGPIVLNLATIQQYLGNTVSIWCFDTPAEARHLEESYELLTQTIHTFPVLGPHRLGYSPALEEMILEEGMSFDVVHQHGIWTGVSRAVNKWRTGTGHPTVISPQGSLEPFALRKSNWKKRLALMFYERENLQSVGCMQALSMQEVTDFRAFGLHSPIAIVPNGISDKWLSQYYDSQRFRLKHNIPDEIRTMLFLGRITPKKGLPMLLHAMNRHRDLLRGWRLIIAGVDEFKHQQEIGALAEELALQSWVQFVGPQFDQDKRDAFAAADVFILPSHSEGAPVAILEALGAGVPVCTTKASPWPELIMHNCGWWTDISVEAIADALLDVLHQPKPVLQTMGERGKRLVSEKYAWSHIAEQTLELYHWLVESSTSPAFVLME